MQVNEKVLQAHREFERTFADTTAGWLAMVEEVVWQVWRTAGPSRGSKLVVFSVADRLALRADVRSAVSRENYLRPKVFSRFGRDRLTFKRADNEIKLTAQL